jgi:hypothetical protein
MRSRVALGVVMVALIAPALAHAQSPGQDPSPIVGDPMTDAPEFVGSPTTPDPTKVQRPPRHPLMAPNGLSNLHDDAYQTDTYPWAGPLGMTTQTTSALFARECGSITFDKRGRLVTVCVGLDHPVLAMLDPDTLHVYAAMNLPPREPSGTNPFRDFSGGGYFYLDNRDRAVISAGNRHIMIIGETGGTASPGFELRHEYDLTGVVVSGDKIISALPDWKGRIWFASKNGIVGFVKRRSGAIRSLDTSEPIGNSFAVDENGGVFIVTDKAMYRFQPGKHHPRVVWRSRYPNIGEVKSGQTEEGSGATPTLIGHRYLTITDNADPLAIMVYRRGAGRSGGERVCRQPVFHRGASSTDQSLIATRHSIIVENNFGYSAVTDTNNGGVTSPGIERVDFNPRTGHCHPVWLNHSRAPSVVPKLSGRAGLVYTYSKPPRPDDEDAWYFTAIDFQSGKTVYKRLAGSGFGFNNNFAPVTIAKGGVAYVGVLGGLTRFEDAG